MLIMYPYLVEVEHSFISKALGYDEAWEFRRRLAIAKSDPLSMGGDITYYRQRLLMAEVGLFLRSAGVVAVGVTALVAGVSNFVL